MSLIYTKKKNIAYLTLNRPKEHNAIDPQTVLDLIAAWEDYRDDQEMRCAIITGSGDQSFCSGADLNKLIPLITGARAPEDDADRQVKKNPFSIHQAFLRNFELYKPIIAAVNGHAIAGGMELLYSTDLRVASQDAKFGLQEVKWAIFPMMGSSVKLPQQMPYARAMEMLLTGELISAKEALEFGFVNRVVPRDQVMNEAEKFATVISQNGPLAVRALKKAVLTNIGSSIEDGLAQEMKIALPIFSSRDAQEGPQAFKEKRKPDFQGK